MAGHSTGPENPLSTQESPRNPENPSETILQDILETMHESDIFPRIRQDAPSRFWSTYERVAKQHDEEFLERHNGDMDVLLIFAGLFSAVSSAFIINMESSLVPQPSDTTNALLMILINKVANGTFSDQDASLPVWTGPSSTTVWIQSLAYASLSTSLLAAAGAVLGKQWLGNFKTSRFGRGSLEERCTRRQRKLDGLETWRFGIVISFLPILLQMSLLFFGIALSANTWTLQQTISKVIIGTSAFGAIFYCFTVLASLRYADCPFETPVSTILLKLYSMIHGLVHRWRELWALFSEEPKFPRRLKSESSLRYFFRAGGLIVIVVVANLVAAFLACLGLILRYLRLKSRSLTEDPESSGREHNVASERVVNLDLMPVDPVRAQAVQWILETSTDPDTIASAATIVLEIEWPDEYDITGVLENRLKPDFAACFDPTGVLLLSAQPRAQVLIDAIVHFRFKASPSNIFYHSSDQYIRWQGMDYIWFGNRFQYCSKLMRWFFTMWADLDAPEMDITSLTPLDRRWVAHMCPYGLCHGDYSRKWLDFIIEFIGERLQDRESSPRVLADCLVSIILMAGGKVDPRELAKLDKSGAISRLHNSLIDLMLPGDALKGKMVHARALRLLHPWSLYVQRDGGGPDTKNNDISIRCLQLGIHLLRQRQGIMGPDENIVISQQINAALRLGLYFTGIKGNDLIWNFQFQRPFASQQPRWSRSPPEWYTQDHCDLLFDYLLQTFKGDDYTLIGNTYIVLGSLFRSPSTSKWKDYTEALSYSMGSEMLVYVRHAALYAVCMVQRHLVSMIQESETLQMHILDAFSSATQLMNTHEAHEMRHGGWELCHLRLLCALSPNPSCYGHLKQHAHFDRCLTTALEVAEYFGSGGWFFAEYCINLNHLFTIMESYNAVMEDGIYQAVQVYKSWKFNLAALCFLFNFNFFVRPDKHNWEVLSDTGYQEALPYLLRNGEAWKNKEEAQESLIRLVKKVSILLEGNPVENTEVRDLSLKIRRLLYTSVKVIGIENIIQNMRNWDVK